MRVLETRPKARFSASVDNEPWRSSRSLASLLCSQADIKHMTILASSDFNKISLEESKIPLTKKLLVYEAQVISVLLCNFGCWSAPKNILFKLDMYLF